MENNLPKAEFDALKSLIRNKELIIQIAEEGNTVALLNRKNYISKMKLIFVDTSKFKKIQKDDSKALNRLIYLVNEIIQLLKRLKEEQEFLIKSIMKYTLQVQKQVFYMIFVKSTKVLLMVSHLFVLYCQL